MFKRLHKFRVAIYFVGNKIGMGNFSTAMKGTLGGDSHLSDGSLWNRV
jgi:hypothetical protein